MIYPELDLSDYGFIIDVRTPSQYAKSHLAGAVNLPAITDEQFAALAVLQAADPRLEECRYVALSLLNIADAIDRVISTLARQTRILVYSSHGLHRTSLWAGALSVIGFKVDVLPAGFAGLSLHSERREKLFQPYSALRSSQPCRISEAMNDLQRYSLVLDARSEREFAEDHLPSAVNLPVVVTEQYAEVGTIHRQEKDAQQQPFHAYMIGVCYSLRNIAAAIETRIAKLPPAAPVLVYCFRGGKRSRLWCDPLRTLGFSVDRLDQGWKGYRRWVNQQLECVPRIFSYRVLCGPTGCGKTRLLNALREAGAQVLDLEALARHRGSVIGTIPGIEQPSQKLFDTLLLDQLRSFLPNRPIWVESESKKIGERSLPDGLIDVMRAGSALYVDAAMPARIRLWREDYRHFEEDPAALLAKLVFLKPLVGGKEFDCWAALAESGRIVELFERLMVTYYDPLYARSIARHYPANEKSPRIFLHDLDGETLRAVALSLLHEEGEGSFPLNQ